MILCSNKLFYEMNEIPTYNSAAELFAANMTNEFHGHGFTVNMACIIDPVKSKGFRIDYYVDDHGDDHIHVRYKGQEAKLKTDSELTYIIGELKEHYINDARQIIKENRHEANKKMRQERERFLASNPHMMWDNEQKKIVPKTGEQR